MRFWLIVLILLMLPVVSASENCGFLCKVKEIFGEKSITGGAVLKWDVEIQCSDGVDNDLDHKTDCDDKDCFSVCASQPEKSFFEKLKAKLFG